MARFADRADAGRRLAERLHDCLGPQHDADLHDADLLVLGLPRGGVPVAYEVAEALGAPLDVLVVRKLGVPHHPELAFGAIGEDGVRVLNESVLRRCGVSAADAAAVQTAEHDELQRRVRRYRGDRAGAAVAGQTALIVDDGFATGATAKAAALVARAKGARRVVLAAPIGSADTVAALREVADDVVCLTMPRGFFAVGQGYRDFGQTSDAEVCALLEAARRAR